MVDLVDIGLMNESQADGRHRLKDTVRQLSDAISNGIVVDIQTISGLDHVTVTSLRQCDSDVAECSNASVVAKANPRRPAQQRPRAVVTSSNGAMTSSRWRTFAELVFACSLSLYLSSRLRFADYVTILRSDDDSRNERTREQSDRTIVPATTIDLANSPTFSLYNY